MHRKDNQGGSCGSTTQRGITPSFSCGQCTTWRAMFLLHRPGSAVYRCVVLCSFAANVTHARACPPNPPRSIMVRRLKSEVLTQLPRKRRQQVMLDLDEDAKKQLAGLQKQVGGQGPATEASKSLGWRRMLQTWGIAEGHSQHGWTRMPSGHEVTQGSHPWFPTFAIPLPWPRPAQRNLGTELLQHMSLWRSCAAGGCAAGDGPGGEAERRLRRSCRVRPLQGPAQSGRCMQWREEAAMPSLP